jgi:hypothetical protein
MIYIMGTYIVTTGTKTVLTNMKGKARFATYKKYTIINLHLGWTKQLPEFLAQVAYSS